MMTVDDVIAAHVQGLSFTDIGALWGTVNEKLSVAAAAGAARVAAADAHALEDPAWSALDSHLQAKGVTEWGRHHINLDDPLIHEKLPPSDFVYCSGIVYHCPSPLYTIERLRTVTNRYLLLGSMVVPEFVHTTEGHIDFSGGQALFLPAMDDLQRRIMAAHLSASGLTVANVNGPEETMRWPDGSANYGPWWWFMAPSTLRAMLRNAGFDVIQDFPAWDGRAHAFFCERVTA